MKDDRNEIIIRDLAEIDDEFADAGFDAFGNGMDYWDEQHANDESALEQYAKYNEEQLKRRKEIRYRKRRRRRNAFLAFLLLVFLCVAGYFIVTSEFFDVKHIEVQGNVHFSKEEVVKISKGKTGGNIFTFNNRKLMENLEGDPYIKSVRIKRKLPATIVLMVLEREPAAAVTYGEKYIILDDEGFVLEKIADEPQLTLISGITIRRMEEGKALKVEEIDVLADTLNMLKVMKESDLFFKKIEVTNVTVNAYIYDTLICRGLPQNILSAMESGNLQAVLVDLYNKGLKHGVINIGDKNYCAFTPEY